MVKSGSGEGDDARVEVGFGVSVKTGIGDSVGKTVISGVIIVAVVIASVIAGLVSFTIKEGDWVYEQAVSRNNKKLVSNGYSLIELLL